MYVRVCEEEREGENVYLYACMWKREDMCVYVSEKERERMCVRVKGRETVWAKRFLWLLSFFSEAQPVCNETTGRTDGQTSGVNFTNILHFKKCWWNWLQDNLMSVCPSGDKSFSSWRKNVNGRKKNKFDDLI